MRPRGLRDVGRPALIFLLASSTILLLFFGRTYYLPIVRNISDATSKTVSPEPEQPPVPFEPHHIVDENFPAAAANRIPSINPANHAPPDAPFTPLFIGFTRNWPVLQQAVVSYLTAGWPAEMIYVVDNTGTMDSNERGLLSLQNPFFMNYTRLNQFGVKVLTMPTLLSFAQLQNYFLYHAITNKWDHYWWSHMDSVAVSWEDKNLPYHSLYQNILRDWAEVSVSKEPWSLRMFFYDRLALVNVESYKAVGGWDTFIPFYGTDCDMHSRLLMKGYTMPDAQVGYVFDVGGSLPDLQDFYPADPQEGLDSARFKKLMRDLDQLQREKNDGGSGSHDGKGRNYWQGVQAGGEGEPFYRDPDGFEKALRMWFGFGQDVMAEKWGHKGCDIMVEGVNRTFEDQWRVPHDWKT